MKFFSACIAAIAWLAIIIQLVLMIQNRVTGLPETLVRFFSFFTILSNIIVAAFFSQRVLYPNAPEKHGTLTAVTVYITVVFVIYQLILKQDFAAGSWQYYVDNALHGLVPILVIVFWALYESKQNLSWRQIPAWLIYPFCYTVFVLIRGFFADFYPYPFINVLQFGYEKVAVNCFFVCLFFVFTSAFYVGIGKLVSRNKEL